MSSKIIRVGTRKSQLALIQTEMVCAELKRAFPDAVLEVVAISTTGDRITDRNLYDIGGKALFLKEIEENLLDNQIDIAVHSLKDVPGVIEPGLKLAAVLEREDPRDCFLSYQYKAVSELPKGAIIGTSSVRRKVLLACMRPDLKFVQFRGNINTRLQKLRNEEVDATILACAGLKRANLLNSQLCRPIEVSEMLPAAGQGVIAVQIRSDDQKASEICSKINHIPTWHLANAERGFMTYLDASCRTPMSAYARYDNDKIKVSYMLSDIDGKNVRFTNKSCDISYATQIGIDAAKELE